MSVLVTYDNESLAIPIESFAIHASCLFILCQNTYVTVMK